MKKCHHNFSKSKLYYFQIWSIYFEAVSIFVNVRLCSNCWLVICSSGFPNFHKNFAFPDFHEKMSSYFWKLKILSFSDLISSCWSSCWCLSMLFQLHCLFHSISLPDFRIFIIFFKHMTCVQNVYHYSARKYSSYGSPGQPGMLLRCLT